MAKQQAISTALLSYMVQHELEGNLLIKPVGYASSDDSDVAAFFEKQEETVKLNVKENIHYTVSKVSENLYGEVFVLIKASPSSNANDSDSVAFSWASSQVIDSNRYHIASDFSIRTSAFAMRMVIDEKEIPGNPNQDEQEGYFIDVYLAGRNEANGVIYDESWKWRLVSSEDEDFDKNFYPSILPAAYVLDNLGITENVNAIDNCLGTAYYNILLKWLRKKSLWEQMQPETYDEPRAGHFKGVKRKATPIRLGVSNNILCTQHYKK
jgi:hypothetical protein